MPFNRRMDKEMWYIYTMEYYTAEKNNDIMKFAGKWMKLENVILSEVKIPRYPNIHRNSPEARSSGLCSDCTFTSDKIPSPSLLVLNQDDVLSESTVNR
ncbi:hypothetical protein STEG23_019308, partial [Scotinomys teguina]